MLSKKLNQLVEKYGHGSQQDVSVILQNKLEFNTNFKVKSEIDDFDQSRIIIIFQEDGDITNYKFINEYIDRKKTIMLVVSIKFDFDLLVKHIHAHSIDAISWRKDNGVKSDHYIVVINKY